MGRLRLLSVSYHSSPMGVRAVVNLRWRILLCGWGGSSISAGSVRLARSLESRISRLASGSARALLKAQISSSILPSISPMKYLMRSRMASFSSMTMTPM